MTFDYKRMIKFEHNIGEQEKKYRLMGGTALILLSIFMANILFLIVGMVLVATGYSGWCPAYSGMHKNTCNTHSTDSQ
jgi:hypothetical protein